MKISSRIESLSTAAQKSQTVGGDTAAAPPKRSWMRSGMGLLSGTSVRTGVVTLVDQGVVSVTSVVRQIYLDI